MKLAARLELHLNRLFLISSAVGVLVLLMSTYFSISQEKSRALNLIAMHVSQITTAEVNSNSISDIDGEVARLYKAWKATQDADIRVDIYLDGKLVGHAGQLQPFGHFSSQTSRSYSLPSGQKIIANVDLDLMNQLLFNLITIIVFVAFIAGCYVLLKRNFGNAVREMTLPLENRISWLTRVSKELPNSIRGDLSFEESSIDEVRSLDSSLLAFTQQILNLEDRVKRASFDEGRVQMAEQVAHSIKGSLAALRLRIENSDTLKFVEKKKFMFAVNNVSRAAQGLLKARKGEDAFIHHFKHDAKNLDLYQLLQSIVEIKTDEIPKQKKIEITFQQSSTPIFIRGIAADLEGMFGNLIDNAIEAINSTGRIEIDISQNENVSIKVSDSGCGISQDILPELMKEGKSFGKADGNGLGLFYAKTTIESMGGKISIDSTPGQGTDVNIEFPTAREEIGRTAVFELISGQTIVITDDDPLVHASYAIKLSGLSEINIVNLNSAKEFEDWMGENGPGEFGSRLYLMDFDLKDRALTGLSLIQKYNLNLEAYLVTGMADAPNVIASAKEAKVRLRSKDEIPDFEFKIVTTEAEAVLRQLHIQERGIL